MLGVPKLIDAAGAAQARLTIEGEIPVSSLPRLAGLSQQPYGEARVKIGFMPDGRGRPAILGDATTTVHLSCQRCLETMPVELVARVNVLVEDVEQASRLSTRSRVPKHADLRGSQHNASGQHQANKHQANKGEIDRLVRQAGGELEAGEAEAIEAEPIEAEPIEANVSRFALHELLEDELLLALPDAPVHPQGLCEAPAFDAGDASVAQGGGEAAGDEARADEKPPSPFAILETLKSDDKKSADKT